MADAGGLGASWGESLVAASEEFVLIKSTIETPFAVVTQIKAGGTVSSEVPSHTPST
jgi:hypothetical protein